jgi:microcystin-dependent protein
MAVQTAASAFAYTGNNSTVTVYPFPAPFLLPSDIYVHVKVSADDEDEGEVLQQGVDYTLNILTDTDNLITAGEITTAIAYAGTYTVTIFRQVPLTQLTEFPETGPFPARSVEQGYDKLVMALQQMHRRILALEGIEDNGSIVVVPEGSAGQDALQDVATFAGATARSNAAPKRVGQLGVQLDNRSLWQSFATTAGAWTTCVLDEDNMASDSAIHPPSQQSVKAYSDRHTPAGVVAPYAGSSAPTGWILCYGQAVSRVTYAALFTAISTTYGSGDGSTTFNVPDLRGRTVAGKDNMGGSAASRLTNSGTGNPGINGSTLGAAGGADRHQLTVAQLAAHTHLMTTTTPQPGVPAGSGVGFIAAPSSSTGGDEAHPNVQPTLVLNYIIRT